MPDSSKELLAKALSELRRLKTENAALKRGGTAGEPIAVVGRACRFPGGEEVDSYWDFLAAGRSAIRPTPPDRAEGTTGTFGSYLDHPDLFDAAFFGISPREAQSLDPQQRLLLELAWQAFESGNLRIDALAGRDVGVFVGMSGIDYALKLFSPANRSHIDPYFGTGSTLSPAAGRLSYFLKVNGPSMVVDTACSSALVALHLAVESLRRGECEAALAAGVNRILGSALTVNFAQSGLLAPDGCCHAFDERAHGYARGEGGGAMVLKRLRDAEAAGDTIFALILGSAVNQDGGSGGLTVPSGPAQQKVIRRALQVAGLAPQDVDYVEAHGTATRLGDPIEAHALMEVFAAGRDPAQPLRIGSVKTNLGHLEAAAGMASCFKVMEALRHEEIPPHLNFSQPSSHIDWAAGRLRVVNAREPWPAGSRRRVAGVSGFGFAGTNAHIVFAEAPGRPPAAPGVTARRAELLVLSAKSPEALRAQAGAFAGRIETLGADEWAAAAWTSQIGRVPLPERAGVVADSPAEAAAALRRFSSGAKAAGVGSDRVREKLRTAFVFTGQGAQYAGMGRALYAAQPLFREIIDDCAARLLPALGRDLRTVMFTEPAPEAPAGKIASVLESTRHTAPRSELDQTMFTQAALFVIEYALARLWQSWGVRPEIALGHSVGEVAAACIAGVFDLDDALKLIVARGRLMQERSAAGAMLTVFADEAVVAKLVAPFAAEAAIAAVNGPEIVLVSGAEKAIAELETCLAGAGLRSVRMRISHAFHSPLTEVILPELGRIAASLRLRRPSIPLISNVTGGFVQDEVTDPNYWVRHLRQSVRFCESMTLLHAQKLDYFIEIGPEPTLLGLDLCFRQVREQAASTAKWLPSLRRGRDDLRAMLDSAGRIWAAGAALDWAAIRSEPASARVSLPLYPFQRKRHWFESNDCATPVVVATDMTRPAAVTAEVVALALTAPVAESEPAAAAAETVLPARTAAGPRDVLAAVQAIISEVSGLEAADLGRDSNLLEMGLDSLMFVRAGRTLEKQFRVTISIKQFYEELHRIGPLIDFLTANAPADWADAPAPVLTVIETRVPAETTTELRVAPTETAVATPRIAAPVDPRMTGNFAGLKLDEQPLSETQLQFLRAFTEQYTARTRRSKERTQAWRHDLADWKASLQFKRSLKELKYPIISDRAEGARIWDIDGNEYVDLALGMGVHFLGHGPAFIKDALHRQVDRTTALGPQSDLAGDVARKICQLTGAERVSLAITGTGAVILAQRLARAATGRPLIAQFAGAYHGFGSEVLVAATEHGPQPLSPGIPASVVANSPVLDYGSEESLEWIRAHADRLAAVIVEPVQSRRPGFQPHRFLRRLRRLTAELDVALIFDEMINGFRIQPGGAQAWFGIQADLVTYGKIVGGGMPLSAVAGKARYLDWIDGGFWRFGDESAPTPRTIFTGGTHNRHPLALAAADAALDHLLVQGPSLHDAVNRRTERLGQELNAFFEAERVPFRAAWFGSQFRLEALGDAFDLEVLFYLLTAQGFYTWEQRICCLSVAHTDADIDRLIAAVRGAVAEMRAGGFALRTGASAPRRVLPLSSVQARLFALCAREGAEMPYHLSGLWELRGPVDLFRLQDAFQEIIRRHESLRTAFVVIAGEPRQYVVEEPRFFLQTLELAGRSPEALLADFIQPFPLDQPPLIRVGYAPVADNHGFLFIDVHHIAADGGSMNVVLREFAALYDGVRLAPVRQQYRHAMDELERSRAGEPYRAQAAYWREQLSGPLPVLTLPTDFPRSGEMDFRGDQWGLVIPPERTRQLEGFAREHGGSLFMLLVAAFGTLLHRLTEAEDVLIGLPVAGRPGADSEEVVGMFVNSLPLRLRPRADQPFHEFFRSVRGACLGAYDHADYAFGELVEALELPRSPDRNPLFDVMFAYENADSRVMRTRELEIRTVDQFEGSGMFDFNVDIIREAGTLNIRFHYATRLFRRATVQRWGEAYGRLLDAMLAEPQAQLGRLPLLSDVTRDRLRIEFNAPAGKPRPPATLVGLWRSVARAHADAVALVRSERRLTYGEVDVVSDAVALRLTRSHGVGRGDRVALLLEASEWMVIAILGVWKAGAAYVPIEPANPAARVQMVLEDAGVRVVLVDEILPVAAEPDAVPRLDVRALGAPLAPSDGVLPSDTAPATDDIAYVIYTSGTSGRPKGVLIEHAGIANSVQWRVDAYALTAADATLQMPSYAFDASLLDIFSTLLAGGRLVLASASDKRDLAAQAGRMVREGITNLLLTPSLHSLYLQEIASAMAGLRFVCVAGEATPVSLLRRHFERLPRVRLFNEYGPTENSVVTTFTELFAHDETVTVGRPVAGNRVYVIQPNGEPCDIGVPGELVVSGPGLARGYLNRPELTAAAFTPAPWSATERIYHTGDLARWRVDGTLDLLGRRDAQVKLRGYRIELQEVEELLARQPGVKAAAATIAPLAGEPQLIAYAVAGEGYDETVVRAAYRAALPVYMMPSAFVLLPQLPMNASGKVDRRALPLPTAAAPAAAGEPPRGKRELALAEVWSEVLRRTALGREDDYFRLGGDSIRGIQIISRLLARGWRLDMRLLFRHPTIAGLAPHLVAAQTAAAVAMDAGPVAGDIPLTPIQRWFFELLGAHPDHFNQAVWLKADGRWHADALTKALHHVIGGHDAFCHRYTRSAGAWRQTVANAASAFSCRVVDLRGAADPAAQMTELVRGEQAGLNVGHGPLSRAVLVQLDEEDRLFWTVHHLVVDGVSWRILLEDLTTAYAALVAGRELAPITRTVGFGAWSQRVHAAVEGGSLRGERAYWLQMVSGAGATFPVQAAASPGTPSQRCTLAAPTGPAGSARRLEEAHAGFRTRGVELFLTALRAAHAAWNPGNALYVQLEGHGRESGLAEVDVSRTVGWFTSVYPVRFEVAGQSLERLIVDTKETLRRLPGNGAGFGWLREVVRDSELRAAPLPDLSFNFLGAFDEPAEGAGFTLCAERPGEAEDPRHPVTPALAIYGYASDGRLYWHLAFDAGRFARSSMEALLAGYVATLDKVAAQALAQAGRTPRGVPTPSDFAHGALSAAAFARMLERHGWQAEDIGDIYPLSPMQQGLYYEALNAPASEAYFEQMAFRLEGRMDHGAFSESWRALVARQPALRSVFVAGEEDGSAVQVVRVAGDVPVRIDDLRGRSEQEQRAAVAAFLAEDRARPFILGQGPLMRVQLFQLAGNCVQVVWSHHHILMDGWCVGVLYEELMQLYAARVEQRVEQLPPVPEYRAYVRWLQAFEASAATAFWRRELDGYETLATLPRMELAPAAGYACRKDRFPLRGPAWDRLLALAAASGATPAILLQSLWGILLARYNQTTDVIFGGIVSGRPETVPGVERMVGLFINALPIRIRFAPSATLADVLRTGQDRAIERRPYECLPLAEIQAGVPGRAKLFDHLVVLENYPMEEELRGSGSTTVTPSRPKLSHIEGFERTQYDFTLVATPLTGGFDVEFTYNSAVLPAGQMQRVQNHLQQLVEVLAADPLRSCLEVEWLPESERRQLEAWNATATRFPTDATLVSLFAEQAARHADRPAVTAGPVTRTYAELAAGARRLGAALRAAGVTRGDRVAIWVPRTDDMIVALLGTLFAGGCYVPLDPEYPEARLRFILEDSGAQVVVAHSTLRSPFAPLREVLVDKPEPVLPSAAAELPRPEDPAYIIYTSGSTGKPKGCLISHRNVVRLLRNDRFDFEFGPADVWVAAHSFCFDFSVWEMYGALLYGGRVVVAPREVVRDVRAFAQLVATERVTVLNQTPAAFYAFAGEALNSAHDFSAHLRYVVFGGDRLEPRYLQPWVARFGSDRPALINMYGITETTVHVTFHRVDAAEVAAADGRSLIGRPLPETQVWVLDEQLRVLPIGIPGELYVGGTGVGLGYLNRPELTAERFLPDPFVTIPGTRRAGSCRLYRTGDLGRWREDGQLEYLGRNDHQVQVRGFRVELGEVEAACLRQPGVAKAVVLPIEQAPGQVALVAYLVGAERAPAGLRAALAPLLPAYMVPAHFEWVPAIPLTANGKIDRAALLRTASAPAASRASEAPRNEVERRILALWSEVLGTTALGIHDNFFDVGGHSLKAVRMRAGIEAAFQVTLSLRDIFAHPTIAELAQLLGSRADRPAGVAPIDPELAALVAGLSPAELEAHLRKLEN